MAYIQPGGAFDVSITMQIAKLDSNHQSKMMLLWIAILLLSLLIQTDGTPMLEWAPVYNITLLSVMMLCQQFHVYVFALVAVLCSGNHIPRHVTSMSLFCSTTKDRCSLTPYSQLINLPPTVDEPKQLVNDCCGF